MHKYNIIQKITKYGGNVVSVVILFNQFEGEYANIVSQNEKIITVLNIYEIFNHLETNNMIELFYCERVKFYCEKVTKLNIKKLLESDKKEEIQAVAEPEPVAEAVAEPVIESVTEPVTEPFVGQ